MKIAGFLKSSLNEWEGRISSVIWTPICNWKCPYCHAGYLLDHHDSLIDEEMVLDYIDEKEGWVDGLVISGGEPTLQSGLVEFVEKVNNDIKIETNGSRPNVINKLLCMNLIECLCLDFKQMPYRLKDISGSYDSQHVIKSYELAFDSDIDIEFHTTLCPRFIDVNSIKEMGELLDSRGMWVLQQYDPSNVLFPEKAGMDVYSYDDVMNIVNEAKKLHNNVIIKNI